MLIFSNKHTCVQYTRAIIFTLCQKMYLIVHVYYYYKSLNCYICQVLSVPKRLIQLHQIIINQKKPRKGNSFIICYSLHFNIDVNFALLIIKSFFCVLKHSFLSGSVLLLLGWFLPLPPYLYWLGYLVPFLILSDCDGNGEIRDYLAKRKRLTKSKDINIIYLFIPTLKMSPISRLFAIYLYN